MSRGDPRTKPNMTSPTLRNVLEKMDNSDSDFRFMATSDLLQQLQSPSLRADTGTQNRLCRGIMKLLHDSNSEVQGMAMKCLAPLASFVEVECASYLVEKLWGYILGEVTSKAKPGSPENVSEKAMRDVSSLGLKQILAEVAPDGPKASTITKQIAPELIRTVRDTKAVGDAIDLLIETLELLHDVLGRMGNHMTELHPEVSEAIFKQLPSPSAMITKRAMSCIGALASTCENSLFGSIVERTLADLRSHESQKDVTRTGVQIIWALSKSSGHRLAVHVESLAPILFDYSMSEIYAEDDELREHCLQAVASFCLGCKREMEAFGKTLANCVITLAKYDPNYAGDEVEDVDEGEEDDETGMGEDDDMGDEFDDDEDYSDDDDSSWKVRRAAIRCLHAAITVELLSRAQLFAEFGPFLITRFKEREEPVKLDVFTAFSELLRLGGSHAHPHLLHTNAPRPEIEIGDAMAVDADEGVREEMSPILSRGPQIMRSIKKELTSRSLKTRIKAMALLRDCVSTMPTVMTPLTGKVIPDVEHGMADSATAMKTESLLLLRGVVRGGGAEALMDHIGTLIPKVLAAADDRYYKVTAECLRFCGDALISFGKGTPECKTKILTLVPRIHDAALARATAQDQDSEVKEAALRCLGASVSFFGSELGPQRLSEIATVLCDRLGNEVTRLPTVRALHAIAISEAAEVLIPVLGEVTMTVGGFLRKNNASLRAASLELLCASPVLPPEGDAQLLANVSELVTDSDLRLTCMALQLAVRLVGARSDDVVGEVAKQDSVYSRALALAASPLLQGRSVDALIVLFRKLAEANTAPLTVEFMLENLMSLASSLDSGATAGTGRASPLHCLAKCVVAVCDEAEPGLRTRTAEKIVADVKTGDLKMRIFCVICLGEFGRSSAVAKTESEKQRLQGAVLAALEEPQAEMRTAAAIALGGIMAADGASGIPVLVSLIKQRPEHRYLLLLSLKEAISSASSADLGPVVSILLPLLFEEQSLTPSTDTTDLNGESSQGKRVSEESVRTATAECLGLLARASPEEVMKALVEGASSQHADIRASVASAVKFAVSSNPSYGQALLSTLRSSITVFIQLIGDSDVQVAKSALQAVNAIAKSRPAILVPHLSAIQHLIFARLVKDKSLIRVVDLGPFKHEEDFGLDMRKSAFDCMRTFVSGPLCSSLSLNSLVENILVGLGDHADVRSIAQLILATAAATPAAPQMVDIMHLIVRALEATFNEKVKQNAVRQETERHDDSIRGALRAVRMLETVPEIAQNRRFQTFMATLVRTSRYLDKYEAIGRSDVEQMTFGNMTGAENGLSAESDVVMTDR